MNQSFFDALPWWMNPKYPMGRTDYFWATWGVGILLAIGYLATCFCIGVAAGFTAAANGTTFNADEIPGWMLSAALVPWFFAWVPLEYRRCKASAIPYYIVWLLMGLTIVDLFAWPDSPVTPITLFTVLIQFWIWLAPSRIEVVRTNPNSENLFPDHKS